MATIRRRESGNYQAQIRLAGLKPISKTFPTKTQAKQFVRQVEGDAKLAQMLGDPLTNSLTIFDLITAFVEQYSGKDKTILLNLNWWLQKYGHFKVSKFTEDTVRQAINHLIEHGRNGRGMKPQTSNRYKSHLSTVFKFAQGKFGIKDNPCKLVSSQKEGKGRQRFLSQKEQLSLLEASKKSKWDKLYLFCLLAITTGARKGELLKLRWNHIDFKNKIVFFGNTKNGDNKEMPLTSASINELKLHRKVGNELIFSSPVKPKVAYDFRIHWAKVLIDANIPEYDLKHNEKLVIHSMRHSFCSTLANSGAELQDIATLAGHKSIQTTMRYIHVNNERKKTVVDSVFGKLKVK